MAEDERAYRRQRRAYRVLRPAAGALMKGLLNYRAEPAPKTEGPCLILSNHVTDFDPILDRKSTRLNSSHPTTSRMPSSA